MRGIVALFLAAVAVPTLSAQIDPALLINDFTPPQGGIFTRPDPDSGAWQKRLLTATSPDGLNFTRTNQIITDQANVADFLSLPNGLLFLYYAGGTVGDRTNAIAAALSPDQGKTWFFKYVNIEGFSGPPPGDPDVRLLDDGVIRLYFTAGRPGGRFPEIQYADSTDGLNFRYRGPAFAIDGEAVFDSFTVPIAGEWHMYTLGSHGLRLWHGVSTGGETYRSAGPADFLINGRPYIPTNEIVLEDGRLRFYSFTPGTNGDICSFVTTDGYTWEPEPGVRLSVDTSAGLEREFVKDAAVVRLPDGAYLMAYTTLIPQ